MDASAHANAIRKGRSELRLNAMRRNAMNALAIYNWGIGGGPRLSWIPIAARKTETEGVAGAIKIPSGNEIWSFVTGTSTSVLWCHAQASHCSWPLRPWSEWSCAPASNPMLK